MSDYAIEVEQQKNEELDFGYQEYLYELLIKENKKNGIK